MKTYTVQDISSCELDERGDASLCAYRVRMSDGMEYTGVIKDFMPHGISKYQAVSNIYQASLDDINRQREQASK